MVRYTGNRYTTDKKLTEREAETLKRMLPKLLKLLSKEDRDPFTVYELNNASLSIQKAIKAAGRGYVLTNDYSES